MTRRYELSNLTPTVVSSRDDCNVFFIDPEKMEGKLVLNDVCKLFTWDPAVSVLVSVFAELEDKLILSVGL